MAAEGTPAAAVPSPAPTPASVFDVLRPGARAGKLAELRGAIRSAAALVWASARALMVATIVLQVVSSVLLLAQVFLGRAILARLFAADRGGGVPTSLVVLLAVLGVATALYAVTLACTPELQRLMTQRVAGHAMSTLLDATARVEYAAFDDPLFEDALMRARVSSQNRPGQIVSGLMALTQATLMAGAMVATMAALAPAVLPILLVGHVAGPWLARRNADEIHQAEAELTAVDRERFSLEDLMTTRGGAKEVRGYRLQSFLLRRHRDLWRIRIERSDEVARARARRLAISSACAGVSFIAAVALLAWMVLTERLSISTAATVAVLVPTLAGRLRTVGSGASSTYECALFTSDLNTFLGLAADVVQSAGDRVVVASALRRAEVDRVEFRYPGTDRLVLRGVSLEVGPGEVVALVGENGSGKTTLAMLLAGLYEPTSGSVLWNETPYGDLDPEALAARIALVNQDFVRFEMTAALNVGLGRHEAVDDRAGIREAAARAGAGEVIDRLPAGYDTILTRKFQGGSQLSGGQWQRMALARALFAAPDLLILDEPSASLDPRAEYELYQGVRSLATDRGIVLISHRLVSCRSADRIYVLEEGVVSEQGPHDELVTAGGLYQELYRLQSAAFA